jgi:hypothetical protein
MLAGFLSVLLLAGLVGAGVWLATDEPEAATPPPTIAAQAPDSAPPAPPREAPSATPTPPAAAEALPPVRIRDLRKAAQAAGCTLQSPPNEGLEHEAREFSADDYDANPPTSGTHFPEWYPDGVYAPGTTPHLGMLVHTLEHGRIDLQYRPGTDAATVARLEAVTNELEGGYHMLLFENGTDMPFAVAATAWDHLLGCPAMNDRVFDAVRAFWRAYVDKGPELIP